MLEQPSDITSLPDQPSSGYESRDEEIAAVGLPAGYDWNTERKAAGYVRVRHSRPTDTGQLARKAALDVALAGAFIILVLIGYATHGNHIIVGLAIFQGLFDASWFRHQWMHHDRAKAARK